MHAGQDLSFYVAHYSRIHGEAVQLVVHVDRVMFSEVKQLLQSLIDEDDADERSKGLFCETGDVAHQGASIGGHQNQTQDGCPKADAGSQGEVGQAVVTGKDVEYGIIPVLRGSGREQHCFILISISTPSRM